MAYRSYKKTILIIEDEDSLRDLVTEELRHEGYNVVAAADGQAGLAVLQNTQADMIICDRAMPTMTGYELLDRLRGIYPQYNEIPFIFLTALTDLRDKKDVEDLEPYAYLEKPLDFDTLLDVIKSAFETS